MTALTLAALAGVFAVLYVGAQISVHWMSAVELPALEAARARMVMRGKVRLAGACLLASFWFAVVSLVALVVS